MSLLKCTQCSYCLPCPAGILIPEVLAICSEAEREGPEKVREKYRRLEAKP